MALYAIGDLHLCLGAPKPMDIFGGAWVGYMDKLKEGVSEICSLQFIEIKIKRLNILIRIDNQVIIATDYRDSTMSKNARYRA